MSITIKFPFNFSSQQNYPQFVLRTIIQNDKKKLVKVATCSIVANL